MIQISLIPAITAALTIGVRLTGLMLFAPFFGSAVIPRRVKAIFVLALTVILFPSVGHLVILPTLAGWPMLILSEFIIGVGMGIATNIVFDAVQLAGQVLGVQLGYSLVNILDPQSQVDTTVMAAFYQSIVMLLFLRMDVEYWLLRAVGSSFLDLPPGSAHLSGSLIRSLFQVAGQIFSLGIEIAAPVLAATMVADIVLGLLGKAAPQMPLMLLGPAIKSFLGLAIIAVTIKYWPDLFHRLFFESILKGEQLLHLAH